MRKIISCFAAAGILLACHALVSCGSLREPDEIFAPVDYTEENAVSDEIKAVRALLDNSDSDGGTRALWRSRLILDKVPSNALAEELFDDCGGFVLANLKDSVESHDMVGAVRLYESLRAAGYFSSRGIDFPAPSIPLDSVPGLSPVAGGSGERKVSEFIKGTVTVYVDKGIKVERGIGFTDAVLGSGFFISRDGYIITNHHVIADMVDKKSQGYSRLYVKLAEDPDTRIPAKVIGWDSLLDLALIKTEVEAPYVFALGSSEDLDVGNPVYAIGSPLGLERTLTRGIISAKDRRLFSMGFVFQIDAAVNSGNSGGPLIDEAGRVQAIVFAGVQNYQGLNFAIPVEYLKYELPFLYAGGEREHPWIGAFGRTQRRSGSGAVNEGLKVQYVMPGSSAYRAGISEDDIIVALNGLAVNSLDDLQSCFIRSQTGTIADVTVMTPLPDGEGFSTEHRLVYLERRPQNPGYEVYRHDLLADSMVPIMGFRLVRASTSNRRRYSVVSVLKGSVADEAGFSESDPVDILGVSFNDEKSAAYIELYAKKRKNGFLDVTLGLTVPMDSQYYF